LIGGLLGYRVIGLLGYWVGLVGELVVVVVVVVVVGARKAKPPAWGSIDLTDCRR
jgi:hypothetical protein